MEYTTHIIAHQYPLSEETFETKLKDVSDQICSTGYSQSSLFNNLPNVVEACVSANYLAFLLEDGRVCRINYTLQTDKLDSSTTSATTSTSNHPTSSGSNNISSNDLSKSNKTKIQNTHSINPSTAAAVSSGSTTTAPPTVNQSQATSASAVVAAAVASATSALSGGSSTNPASSAASSISAQLISRPQSRAGFRSHETFIIPSAQEIIGPLTSHTFSRNRRGQLLRGRVPSLIMGSRMPPMLPPSAVPEALIESVQTVLQSKSRNVIIRELQRTNLDVNLAVNNLLQRDDEGDEGGEDDDPYIHGEDDLISLLDINSHGEHSVIIDSDGSVFDEDTFRISRRLGRTIANSASNAPSDDRDRKSYRLRDQRWYDSAYRDEIFASRLERESMSQSGSNMSSSKPDDLSTQKRLANTNPIAFGDNLQFWVEKSGGEQPVFIKIASLYSELIAVSKSGHLYQWRWSSDAPYATNAENPTVHHPKTLFLNLLNEKILGVSASPIRASVWTESGKIATWLDETVDIAYTAKLQTPALCLFDPSLDSVQQLSVSNLFTVVKLASGAIYWWGLMPFEHRVKLIEKYQSKANKLKLSQTNDITVGSYVSLKTFPLYNSGTIAITVKDGQPKIGQIMEHLFSFKDAKLLKFKLKPSESFREIDKGSTVVSFEMPPPALPTIINVDSSSQSSTSSSNSLKRKKTSSSDLEEKYMQRIKDEESWSLAETIFVEDTKPFLLGKVLKIDSDYVMVKMQAKSIGDPTQAPEANSSEAQLLENCRILLKNQLQAVKASSSFKLPDFNQRTPKRISDIGHVITFVPQHNGIHALVSKEGSIYYIFYDIVSNKIVKEKKLPTRTKAIYGQHGNQIKLNTLDDPNFNLITLIDGNSTFYPLIDIPGSNMIRDPSWKNLFPIKYFSQVIIPPKNEGYSSSSSSNKKNVFLTLFSMRIENLVTNILRGDYDKVTLILKQLENDSRGNVEVYSEKIKRILNERIDGNRNIFHAAVFACAPVSNKDVDTVQPAASIVSIQMKPLERSWSSKGTGGATTSNTSSTVTPATITTTATAATTVTASAGNENPLEMNASISDHSYENRAMDTTDAIPTSFWPPLDMVLGESSSFTNNKSKESTVWPQVKLDEKEKRQNSIKILQALLETSALKDFLVDLLAFKNAEGATPFMYAVNIRAYNAALCILDAALNIRTESVSYFYKIIYPQNSSPDNCPLYVLCCNDTCSFTWTGDNHITQDIFECKTCTLVGNLCCCTECARTCHKGHDCKIKTSSPTAYCDCWEKCKCKSLIAGDQEKRYELLCKLLTETNLLIYPNSRGEHLLLFLAQMVGRQIQEQRNYKRGNTMLRKNLTQLDVDMPQHDLEPPKFSRRALDRILNDWNSVKDMILFNFKIRTTPLTNEMFDESIYFDHQNGSIDLDKFLHCLIMKCPQEMLNTLVTTMNKELSGADASNYETNLVVRRFIRSVARLFVLLNMETVPSQANIFNQTNLVSSSLKYRKTTSSLLSTSPISKCEQIFKQFPKLSVEELSNSAQSLITPVLLGIAKPSMFKPISEDQRNDRHNYSSSGNNTSALIDELFNVEPSTIQRQPSSLPAYIPHSRTEPIISQPPQQQQQQAQTVPISTSFPSSTALLRQRSITTRRSAGILQQSDILNATSAVNPPTVAATSTQPAELSVPTMTRSVSVVLPNIGEDTTTYSSDQISENDDSESNTRDNYELHEEMELNLFAESDSDSDNSNNSNRDNASAAQRSAITAATVGTGSDPGGVYFSDNDSDVTSNEEDEDSDIRSDILNVDNDNSDLIQFNNEQQQHDMYTRQIQWSVRRHGADAVTGGGSTTSSRLPPHHHSAPLSAPVTNTNTVTGNFTTTTTTANAPPSLYQDIHMRRATHAVPINTLTQSSQQQSQVQTAGGSQVQATPAQVQASALSSIHHYAAHTAANNNSNNQNTDHHHDTDTATCTNNALARSFSLIMRQIRELLNAIYQKDDKVFDVQGFYNLLEYVNIRLEPTWQWMVNILDTTEGHLRFGCASNSVNIDSSVAQYLKGIEDKAIASNTPRFDASHRRRTLSTFTGIHRAAATPAAVPPPVSTDPSVARRDFMNYALSLMRMGSGEHKEMLPHVDLYFLKHVAYIFDGLMCYLRIPDLNNDSLSEPTIEVAATATPPVAPRAANPIISMGNLYETDEIESETEMETCVSYQTDSASEEDDNSKSITATNACTRTNTFFKRSESTLCLGGSAPDPFGLALDEGLVLAAKPHLLHPNSRKQDLFRNETNQVDQFNLLSRFHPNDPRKMPKLVLPSFKKSMSFNQTLKLASSDLNKSTSENPYGASNCLRQIVQNLQQQLQKAHQRFDETTSGAAATTSAADLLDLSVNKAAGATTTAAAASIRSPQAKAQLENPIILTSTNGPTNEFFDRWRVTLDLFGRVYCDDVGLESGSIIRQLGGFQIKEARFRREMEKYRNLANKELTIEVERDRDALLQSTFRALNNLYSRRPTSSNSLPPLCLSRVRVTFKDEQGEGSGVARSFYTAFCDAVLADERLPSLDNVYSQSTIYSPVNSSLPINMLQRYRNSREYRRRQRSKSRDANERQLCKDAAPFYIPGPNAPTSADFTLYDSLSTSYKDIGERLYNKVVQLQPVNAPKITGMLLDLKIQQLTVLLNSDSFLRGKVEEAVNLLASSGESSTAPNTSTYQQQAPPQPQQPAEQTYSVNDDNTPLFWQADKKGFFSPRPGKNSTSRLNAFRNIGRIIGVCLLQNELCPLPLARHVIKYILNRPIKWHDYAFFDSVMYESFRKMITDTEKNGESVCKALELSFNIDLSKDEDGGNFDLIQNGANIEVNKSNMYEFVKRYVEYRMVKHVEKCCEQLKLGVYDVLPANSLNDLNAEDFRLLLNGVVDINVQTLMSYTTFSDESKEGSRRSQFEKWFWSTVEKMSNHEKQELLFFWTGSPYLPASEDGFQPLPSITIRPQSDLHLPTANTCINRLYIPLYTSKSILKSKLLYAIKTKSFGFV